MENNHAMAIAILMPVKNASPWLCECLESIQNQTFKHWKLYAIDDYSTDDSEQILQAFTQVDDRIKHLKNDNQGIIEALRKAYYTSDEPYITRMDADDIMPPFKLEVLYNELILDKSKVITGKVKYFSNKNISEGYLKYENWLNERVANSDFNQWMYRECTVASANWLCTRETLDTVGAFQSDCYPEDYNLVLRWHHAGIRISGVNETTHLWREHDLRTSRNSKNYQQKAFFKLKINSWLKNETDLATQIVLIGKGTKFNLVKEIMTNEKKEFLHVTQKNSTSSVSLEAYTPTTLDKVLICVYPTFEFRKGLEKHLLQKELRQGREWWYV